MLTVRQLEGLGGQQNLTIAQNWVVGRSDREEDREYGKQATIKLDYQNQTIHCT